MLKKRLKIQYSIFNIQYLIIIFILAVFVFGIFVNFTFAQSPVDVNYAFTGDTGVTADELAGQAGLSTRDPREIVAFVINIILGFLGIIAVGLIIYAGFMWMTAAGNADKIELAKKIMTRAAIGLLIILSSFAIATFILRVLLGATGGSGTPGGSNPGGSNPGGGLPAEFLLLNTSPKNQTSNVPRNAKIKFYFNSQIDTDTVASNFSVDIGNGDISYEDDNTVLVFTPNGNCETTLIPDDVCFPKNSEISAYVTEGLQRVEAGSLPVSLNCSSSSVPCSITFTTGDSYDLDLPDGESCSIAGTAQCSDNNLLCASDFCATEGSDCLCRNAPVIDYISPVGGFCEYKSDDILGLDPSLYENKSCQNNNNCLIVRSGSPVNGVCNEIIPNGAIGNMVTISGRWFGDNPGEVYFSGASSPAVLAGVQNTNCGASWSDNEIVVIVPDNAVNGPIKVTSASNYSDTTNDTRGPAIEDFTVNNIDRPGLCKIEPIEGGYKDKIVLHGINFGTPGTDAPNDADKFKYVLFGGITSLVQDDFSWSDTMLGTTASTITDGPEVPNLVPRANISLQVMSLNNILGNAKSFKINRSRFAPRIDNISPLTGATGDYITITGDNFSREKGEIFFSSNDSAEVYDITRTLKAGNTFGSFSFPAECAQDNVWNEKQIIVKVPSELSGSDFYIKVKANDFALAEVWGDNSSEKKFTLGGEPKPGLCKVWPENGVAGNLNKISFYGERFGDKKGGVQFYNATAVDITEVDDWESVDGTDIAKAGVPTDAETGETKVLNNANTESNPLFFRVESCLADNGAPKNNYCAINSSSPLCCPSNTMLAGSCVDSSDQCGMILGATYSQYYVEFSTAASDDIACDADLLTPACEADNNFCETQAGTSGNDKSWCEPESCTCQKPGRPKVIVECDAQNNQCVRNLPSPSPLTNDWDINRGKPLACANAVITARFDQVMDLSSITDDNVVLSLCTSTSTSTCSTTSGSVSSKGYANSNSSYFEYTPHNLSSDMWYKVQLNASSILASSTKLKLVGGEPNNLSDSAESYVWYFKTRDNSDDCNIGCVTVVPTDFTARRLNEKINYKAMPSQEDNACIMINAMDYNWNWDSDDDLKASIYQNFTNPYTSTSTATALKETAVDAPVMISAKETSQLKIGTSTLNINFGFKVEEKWPENNCKDVCLNADIGAKFSSAINNNNLKTHTATNQKVKLYKCDDKISVATTSLKTLTTDCSKWTEIGDIGAVSLHPEATTASDRELSFNVQDTSSYVFLFEPYTVYKAILVGGSAGILSAEGSAIDNPNPATGTDYEWHFATGETICEVTSVDVNPDPGVATLVGQDINYTSIPYSSERLCSDDREQRLRGQYYNWEWHPIADDNNLVAIIPPIGQSFNINNNVRGLNGELKTNWYAENQSAEALGTGEVTVDATYGMSQKTDITAGIGKGTDGSTSIFAQSTPVEGSAEFILQCGWIEDRECHDANGSISTTYGVGNNSCCYPRPWAENSLPNNGTEKVCRNALLEVDFNDPMDISSFAGNVTVAAKFSADKPCPDGREYFLVYDNNTDSKLAKTAKATYDIVTFFSDNIFLSSIEWGIDKVMNFSFIKEILAGSSVYAENLESKWCVVNGNVGGYNTYKGGKLKGVMAFSPTELLPTDEADGREHLILIKGDRNLEDADRGDSVRNIYGTSMGLANGTPVEGIICRGVTGAKSCAINGQGFYGQVIKFTTWADLGTDNNHGICLGDNVRMVEPSWLFQTRENDARDDIAGSMYDTIRDSDKEFTATMMSRDGQALTGMVGYDWEWSWAPRDEGIIKVGAKTDYPPVSDNTTNDDEDPNKSVAVVDQNAQTRARTFFNATATISDNSIVGDVSGLTAKGKTITGSADIRVFLCDNPWPVYIPEEDWPFVDINIACPAGGSACPDTNFEFYYCRDSGNKGTSDDLPAISDNGAIRGYSKDIIKEFLFTRADIPNAPSIQLTSAHDKIQITSSKNDLNYRLFYGTSKNNYTQSANIGAGDNATKEYSLNSLNLADGNTYYFAVKAINVNGAESDFSNEVEHVLGAVINPPTALRANAFLSAKVFKLKWNKSIKNGVVDSKVNDYAIYADVNYSGTGVHSNEEQRFASNLDCNEDNETIECDWPSVADSNRSYYFQVTAVRDNEESVYTPYIKVGFQPIGYWRINEGKGTAIAHNNDKDLNGVLQLISAGSAASGWTDSFYNFNINTKPSAIIPDFPSAGDIEKLNLSESGGFTYSFWMKYQPDSNFIAGIILAFMRSGEYLNHVRFLSLSGPEGPERSFVIQARRKDEKICHSQFSLDNFQEDYWYYISLISDNNNNIKLYINGLLSGEQEFEVLNNPNDECNNTRLEPFAFSKFDRLIIGGNRNTTSPLYFNGNIADVKIYNHIRTDAQIKEDFNNSKARFGF